MNNYKSVRNRLFTNSEVELKSETVELAIGDEANALMAKLKSASNETNSELDKAFTPIRQLESAIRRLTGEIPSKINKFKAFKDVLMKLESQFSKDNEKLKKAEQELGVKIPRPKVLTEVNKVLEKYQREEESFRKEINEFNTLSKRFKSIKVK